MRNAIQVLSLGLIVACASGDRQPPAAAITGAPAVSASGGDAPLEDGGGAECDEPHRTDHDRQDGAARRAVSARRDDRIGAIDRGLSPDQVGAAAPASGLAIGLRAMRMALTRVFKRFFAPYQPNPS